MLKFLKTCLLKDSIDVLSFAQCQAQLPAGQTSMISGMLSQFLVWQLGLVYDGQVQMSCPIGQ